MKARVKRRDRRSGLAEALALLLILATASPAIGQSAGAGATPPSQLGELSFEQLAA